MVRKYKRKSDRSNWSEEDMAKAIEAVLNKSMGYKKAANVFGIPRGTLKNRFKKMKDGWSLEKACRRQIGTMKTVFSEEQELQLVDYMKLMEARLYSVTALDLRRAAYELAEENKLKHNFNREKKCAGMDWLYGFLKRHPDLSLKATESLTVECDVEFDEAPV